jgi:endonuclease III
MTDARPLHDAPRGAVEAERNAALSTWYVQAQRQFPWRETGEPYPILVSEIMLQQTQASRVVPFFDRFMAQFPSVEDLAAAPLSDVLGAWSGLGYNRRARSLHAAAHQISTNGWPATIPGLMELPGIGPYTARAVACFAFGHDEVPVDTNLRRVLSRWHGEPMEGKVLQQIAEGDSDPRPSWTSARRFVSPARRDAQSVPWPPGAADLKPTYRPAPSLDLKDQRASCGGPSCEIWSRVRQAGRSSSDHQDFRLRRWTMHSPTSPGNSS